jgi:uncharacterized protein (DUF3820 family)
MTKEATMTATRLTFGRFKGQPLTEVTGNYLHWILSQSHAGCWAWRNGYVTSALQAAAREELARRGNPLWQPPAVLPTVANVPGVGQVPWHVIAVAFRDDALALPREVM